MLDNPRSARIRAVAALSRREARSKTGLFLVEGPAAVSEALRHQPALLREVYATEQALSRHPELLGLAAEQGIEIGTASEAVLAVMADTITPQGWVAVCRQFPAKLERILESAPRLLVVLEEVRDPGNAGTIIRAADAAGADAVVLTSSSVELYNPKLVRSTTGSLFHLPIAVGLDLERVLGLLRGAGSSILAADMQGRALPELVADGTLARPTAWVFGNEARGLSDRARELADALVAVPIYGAAESMNLATAASVCLYQSAFAQRMAL